MQRGQRPHIENRIKILITVTAQNFWYNILIEDGGLLYKNLKWSSDAFDYMGTKVGNMKKW